MYINLLFSFILIFSISSHAGTSHVGGGNGFSSNAKGESTENSQNNLTSQSIKAEFIEKEVNNENLQESLLMKNTTFQNVQYFIEHYKRLVRAMIKNDLLGEKDIEDAYQEKDYYFSNFFNKSINLNKNIFKKSFLDFQLFLLKNGIEAHLQPEMIAFLKEERDQLSIQSNIKEKSFQETASVFSPKTVNKVKAFRTNDFQYISFDDGKGVVVFYESENTLAIHDMHSGEYLYSIHSSSGLNKYKFTLFYIKNLKKAVLGYFENNEFIVLDLKTKTEIFRFSLELNLNKSVSFPRVIENSDGELKLIFISKVNGWRGETKEFLEFYDVLSGKKLHSSFRLKKTTNIKDLIIVENNNHKNVILVIYTKVIHFIDPETGQEIEYKEKLPYFSYEYNTKAKPYTFTKDPKFDQMTTTIETAQGQKILILAKDRRIYFINPFTGKEIYPSVFSGLYYSEKNLPVFFNTEEGIPVLVVYSESYKYDFINIMNGQSVFPGIETINYETKNQIATPGYNTYGYVPSHPIVYKDASGQWIFALKPNNLDHFIFFDIQTGKKENSQIKAHPVSHYQISIITSINKQQIIVYPFFENKTSFMEAETYNVLPQLHLKEQVLHKVYFFTNKEGAHNSGLALGATSGEVYWYFFNLYSELNESEMELGQ